MATNVKFETSDQLRIAVGSDVESNDIVEVGGLIGVALTDYSAHDGCATLKFDGVFSLDAEAVGSGGDVAIAVGDALYFTAGDDPQVNKKVTGTFLGHSMDALASGEEGEIRVRLANTGSKSGINGVFVSGEVTGTRANQNTAHGLGSVPSAVFAALTEFASNVSVDVAPGTHTATNAVFNVTTGVKYVVIAIK